MENNHTKRKIEFLILYASQTGNCESISDDLNSNLVKQHSSFKRYYLNQHMQKGKFDLTEKTSIKLCIFLLSSTGNGDFPDNGENFERYLRKQVAQQYEDEQSNLFSHIYYTILGLGDSNYSKYQGAPRFLDHAMRQLGAVKFYERGEADEATSLELIVEPWLEGIENSVNKCIAEIQNLSNEDIEKKLTQDHTLEIHKEVVQVPKQLQPKTLIGKVISAQHLVNQDHREIIEISINFDYLISKDLVEVGSSFSVYPQNSNEDIEFIIDNQKWNGKDLIGNKTVEEYLRNEIDIKTEKIKLLKFLSEYDMEYLPEELRANQNLTFMEYVAHPKRIELPYNVLEDDLPKIKQRHYSIVNDPFFNQETKTFEDKASTFTFCFTLHRFSLVEQPRIGFCTGFFRSLLEQGYKDAKIKCQFSTHNRIIKFPHEQVLKQGRPLIMIAHGTGIAPFISILRRIKNSIISGNDDLNLGDIYLFYGCRNDEEDFLYSSDIMDIFENYILKYSPQSHIYLSCSREVKGALNQPFITIQNKGYVQEFLKIEHVRKIIKGVLNDQDGYMMLCGNKNTLGRNILDMLVSGGEYSILSEEKLHELKFNEHIMIELWGE